MTQQEQDQLHDRLRAHYTPEAVGMFIQVNDIFLHTWRKLIKLRDPAALMQVKHCNNFIKEDFVLAGCGALPRVLGKLGPDSRYNVDDFSASDGYEYTRAKVEAQALAMYTAYRRICHNGVVIAYLGNKAEPDIFIANAPSNNNIYSKKDSSMQIKFRFEYGVLYKLPDEKPPDEKA